MGEKRLSPPTRGSITTEGEGIILEGRRSSTTGGGKSHEEAFEASEVGCSLSASGLQILQFTFYSHLFYNNYSGHFHFRAKLGNAWEMAENLVGGRASEVSS
ncbi:hypothetical protein SUGI_0085940 [Cryptomeria japonica]|nr:hypothetical protein SUGI_0085940 [Cryptomeria japonica]